eukprot:TRINITY_DN17592_c2_g1_i2.p1 TRINITY_DN17592_c2_g1~~TRINITY_DN17592_c2_g1_i2.p1  ORF type:complete len:974 (+),score=118.04 TRINITY_DN17592_c2_g1_i2:84-3005(+)
MDLESKMLQGFMATAGKQPSAQRQQQQQIHGGLPQQQFAAPAGWPQGAPYPQMVQQQGMMQPGMMGQGYYPQQHFGGHYMPQQQHAQPQQQGLAAMFAKQKQKELLSLQKGRMLEQQRQAAAIIAQDDFGDFAGGSSLPPPQASQQPAAAEVPDDDFGDFATAPSASAPAAPAPPPQDDSDEFADFQAAAPAVPSVQQPAPPPQPTLLHSDPAVIVSPPPLPSDAAPEAAEGAAEAAGAPSAAPVDRRAAAVSDVRRTTGMTETYARFSLEAAKWDVAEALRLFRLKKASLPAEAFDPAPPPQQQPPPDHTPRQEQPQFPQPAHTSARSASQLSASSFPEDDRSGLGSGAAGTEPPPLPQLAGSPLWPSQQLPPSPPARSPQLTAAAPTTSPTAIGRRLAELEAAKAAAIAREDFDEAKRIKLEVDAIRSQSQPPPSPTGGPPETFVLRRATAAERLGFHLGEDLRLAACADDSPAARAGLRRALGGLLVSINGTPVSSLAECAGHMRELELSLSIRMPPPPRPPSPAAAAAGPAPVGAGAAAGEDDDDFADFQGPAPTPAPAEASNGRQPPDGTADPAHRQPAEHSFEPPPLPSASPPSAPRQPPSTNGAPPPLPSQEADSEFTSWSGAPAHAEWGGEVLPGAATASAATADDGVAPSVGSGMILSDVYHCGKRAAKQPPASAVAAGLRRLCASDDEDSGAEFADFQAAAPSPPPAAPAQPAPHNRRFGAAAAAPGGHPVAAAGRADHHRQLRAARRTLRAERRLPAERPRGATQGGQRLGVQRHRHQLGHHLLGRIRRRAGRWADSDPHQRGRRAQQLRDRNAPWRHRCGRLLHHADGHQPHSRQHRHPRLDHGCFVHHDRLGRHGRRHVRPGGGRRGDAHQRLLCVDAGRAFNAARRDRKRAELHNEHGEAPPEGLRAARQHRPVAALLGRPLGGHLRCPVHRQGPLHGALPDHDGRLAPGRGNDRRAAL